MSRDLSNKIRRVATRDIVPLWVQCLFLLNGGKEKMLDIKFVREHADEVKENMKKKFQDKKIPLVNEVLLEDKELRQVQQHADDLRAQRKKISKEIGTLMGQGKKEEAEEVKNQVRNMADELEALEEKEESLRESVRHKMMMIPNMIEDKVPHLQKRKN